MRERSSKIRFLFYAILFLAMAISLAIPMQAALAVVGPAVVWVDGTSTCTGHALGVDCFATIQEGIDAVVSGGTVNVGAGTYTEQVTVTKSLSLFGDGAGSSIIAAPATLPASSNQTSYIVRFDGAGVTSEFTGFTVTGPGPAACGSIATGILVSGGADANIHDNTIADVRDSVFSGCQNGIAILVGRNAWTTTGTATIENNIVTGYQKGGIVVDNTGSSATITGNTVTGAGTTDVTAQNGIQVSRGATATLTGNAVSGNSFHLDGSAWDWGAAGILLYQAGAVSMTGGNSIHDNDQNLYVDSATAVTVGSEAIGPSTAPLYSGYEVINFTALNFDLTGVTFSEATNCQIEERVWHGVDDTTYGAVYWVAGNLYVAPPESTIQNAIDIATAGDTINVCPGTYAGEIKIDRSVTILGDPGDTAPGPGAFAPVIDGGSAPGDAFLIKNGVSNVTIQGFEVRNFTSDDTGIGNAISAWVGSTSNITVQDNYFHDLEYNGVLVGNDYNADPAKWGDHTGWTIKGNILDNIGYIGFELTNTSNSSIEDNIIHLNGTFIGAVFSSARRSESGLTVKNNLIDGIPSDTYPVIYMYAYDVDMPNPNLDSVLIEGNTIDCPAGTPYQVYMRNIGTGTVTGVQVRNNSFLRLKNLTSATIDASSNYWGSSDPTTVAGNISGAVDFSPLLDNGTDTDLATLGFQPDFSSYTVHTLGSQTGATSLIQEGIDLVNGSTLNVVAGTYAENININKSLNLVGAQAGVGVAGRTAGDAAETTIQGLVSVNASNVSINGFTFTNPGQTSAITIPPSSSNTAISYNMIENVGAPTLSSNVHSIVFQNGADSVNISHNSFNNINANAKSASAISVLDSVSTDPSNDLVIFDNTFTNIASVTKGAYGIIINNKAGAPGAEITFNTFSGLNGNWTHAIGLETDVINPVVAHNNFSNLTVNGAGSDVAAIFFEADPSSHTAKVIMNRFEGTTFYGVLIHPDSVALGYTANAVKNWWGDASGPGLVGGGTGALVGTNVDYTPWCTDMDCTSVYNLVTGNVTASDGTFTNKVMVTWDSYRGATKYILYRGTTGIAGDATELVRRNGTAYADRTATPGVTYYYWVKGCYFADCSDFSASDTGWMGMLSPTDLQASDGTFSDKVQITWTAAPGATSYEVYRSELNGLIKTLLDSPVGTAFDDTTATPGVYYKYWVKSCAGAICSDFGHFERGWRRLPAPENLVASDGTFADKVLVSWDASSEAFYYKVYRGTTAVVGDAVEFRRTKGTQIVDRSATPGTTYHYWVKAFTRRGLDSDFSNSDTGWR